MNRPCKNSTTGQAIVEFALVLTLFLIILWVIFDIGRAVYYYSAVHNAAREGARHGITDPNAARIQAAARSMAVGLDINPVVTFTSDAVEVKIDFVFIPITPVLRLLTGQDQITLHSQASMKLE